MKASLVNEHSRNISTGIDSHQLFYTDISSLPVVHNYTQCHQFLQDEGPHTKVFFLFHSRFIGGTRELVIPAPMEYHFVFMNFGIIIRRM